MKRNRYRRFGGRLPPGRRRLAAVLATAGLFAAVVAKAWPM